MALHEEAADAAGVLKGAGEVEAPDIIVGCGCGIGINSLADKVPSVVNEGICCRGGCFLYAAAHEVVAVGDEGDAVGGDPEEAVFGVPEESEVAVLDYVAVGIIHEGRTVCGVGIQEGILVQFVGDIDVGRAVFGGFRAIADGVIGVGVGVGAHFGGDEFGAGVVAEEVGGCAVVDALGAAAYGVVGVGEGGDDVGTPSVGDEGFEVAEGFVFVGDGEAEVVGVAGEEGGVGDVGITKNGAVGDGEEADDVPRPPFALPIMRSYRFSNE